MRILKLMLLGMISTALTLSAMELRPLMIGQPIPDTELKTAAGKAFDLQAAVQEQPVVLIFYRGGWCPFCNAHLGQLQEAAPQLRELGYQIIGISPDRPEELQKSLEKGSLSYTLLSDSSMAAAKAFGIAFEVDAPMLKKLASYNIDIEAASGETHHLLRRHRLRRPRLRGHPQARGGEHPSCGNQRCVRRRFRFAPGIKRAGRPGLGGRHPRRGLPPFARIDERGVVRCPGTST